MPSLGPEAQRVPSEGNENRSAVSGPRSSRAESSPVGALHGSADRLRAGHVRGQFQSHPLQLDRKRTDRLRVQQIRVSRDARETFNEAFGFSVLMCPI